MSRLSRIGWLEQSCRSGFVHLRPRERVISGLDVHRDRLPRHQRIRELVGKWRELEDLLKGADCERPLRVESGRR
jgi:hypothetical protein